MLRVFSTFTGIGGFEIGMHHAAMNVLGEGIQHIDVVGYSEIDKFAIQVFDKHFKGVQNYGDITKIEAESLPDFDCLVGGFPCQSFSIAGKRGGFSDTRGTLFFDLARILRAKQPRLFVFENVKGLCNHDGGRTFRTIISTIDELGYDCQWQVLNSKDFGVPQNRERIIIVGHLRGTARPQVFPITRADRQAHSTDQVRVGTLRTHKDGNGFREMQSGLAPTIPARARNDGSGQPVILQRSRGNNKGGEKTIAPTLTGTAYHHNNHLVDFNRKDGIGKKLDTAHALQAGDYRGLNRNQNQNAVARPVITPDRANKSQNGRRIKPDGEPAFTVTATDRHGVYDGSTIRRLTPMECERLQAFPDNWTAEGVDGPISDTQRYKMCGNAVTTNVIQAVFERIFSSET